MHDFMLRTTLTFPSFFLFSTSHSAAALQSQSHSYITRSEELADPRGVSATEGVPDGRIFAHFRIGAAVQVFKLY
jgi:hypothetical protein